MSKGNILLDTMSGKLGSLVFYRDGGEQRHRPHVIPKNPRSPRQMAQRVRLANVSALYRLLAPVVRDSFSNRPSNQSGYNAFASGAIELSPFMTKEMANVDAVLPMPAVVSKGTLPVFIASSFNDGSVVRLGIAVPGLISDLSTVGAVSQQLLVAYPLLQNGDIITLLAVGFSTSQVSDDADAYSGQVLVLKFEVDTSSQTSVDDLGFLAGEGGLYVDSPNVVFTPAGTSASAVIVSRTDADGQLQTSFSRLVLSEAAQSLYDGYRTDAALQQAIESYNAGSASILR